MGFIDKIEKEASRAGGKISKEVERFGHREWVQDYVAYQTLGLGGRYVKDAVTDIRKAKKAEKETLAAAKELQAQQRIAQQEQELRQASALRLTKAEQARAKRISMAEGMMGEGVGIVSTVPVDGPNMDVNKVPMLDPIDGMGNSIPEV